MKKTIQLSVSLFGLALASPYTFASCADIAGSLPANGLQAIVNVVSEAGNGGYGLPMWVAAVDETGKVCAVINTAGQGANIGNSSWLGSRVIAVQKANTANAFSLDDFAISTANLYGLTLPGGSLYGLQHSNPVDATAAYAGSADTFGSINDPLIGKRIGGVNVFGGGLALYSAAGKKVGAIGVSGDTSCTDHAVAWKIRTTLNLDHVPAGFISGYDQKPADAKGDEMIIGQGNVANTYKQVSCAHNDIANPDAGSATGVIIEP